MTGTIQLIDFEWLSWYPNPEGFRDYRLTHLPTGMKWEIHGRAGLTSRDKARELVNSASRDLVALGWQPSEEWTNRVTQLNEQL